MSGVCVNSEYWIDGQCSAQFKFGLCGGGAPNESLNSLRSSKKITFECEVRYIIISISL